MPLYELIVIARAGNARGSTNLMKQLSLSIFGEGGNVRGLNVLGDRVLTKEVSGNDDKKHLVGRYLQVLFDGSPNCKSAVELSAKSSFETIRCKTFRVKDFFNDVQMYKKAMKQESPFIAENQKNRDYILLMKEIQKKNDIQNNVKTTNKVG